MNVYRGWSYVGSAKKIFTYGNWALYNVQTAKINLTNLYEKRDDNLGVGEKYKKNATKHRFQFGNLFS